MPSIHYGSLFLDSETAVLFLALAFLAWLLKCRRLAAACGAAGLWLVLSPWLEPIFMQAFAHVPLWVLVLILLFAVMRFAGALLALFMGRGFGRDVMVHATAPLVADALRFVYRVPIWCLRCTAILAMRIVGISLGLAARALLRFFAP